MDPLIVDVIMGGPGREAPVSRLSGATIVAGLREAGHDVAEIDITDRLDPARLRMASVVFNIVHGTYGEDGVLQAELEAAGWPYVGSDAASSRLCMDKEAAKQRLREHGVPVPRGLVARPGATAHVRAIASAAGVVIKPVADGSSVGLRLLGPQDDVARACAEVWADIGPRDLLVEERLTGPEYTVAVIQGATGELKALPPIRIVPAVGSYDYQAKYIREDTRYEFLHDGPVADRLRGLGTAAFAACGCRDVCRIDVMDAGDGTLKVLELNTLPGFTSHSLVPKAAAEEGLPLPFLLDHLVRQAAPRRTCRCCKGATP